MLLAAGARLGPYEIVTPLGAGGMGEVYRARDTRLNRTVAIKILSADMAADPQRQARFRREARAISSLTHPHICTLHDVGEQDGLDFLVMEYLAGETLAHRLLRGALPLEDALRIGAQLADALDAAHRQGLTHRDLKPANVMLAATGAKVLDFGLAKWHEGESAAPISVTLPPVPSTLTQVGAVVGTLQYMAPEQVEGKPADARSDLFALGAILYEMTTGRKAFEGPTATSVMAAILSSTPPPMSTLQPVTPPALDRVVRKCLAKDPSRRWQSAADLRDELAWIADDPAATSTGPTTSAAMTVSSKGRSVAAWTTAAAAAVLAVLVALFLGRSASPGLSLPMHFTVLPPDSTSGVRRPNRLARRSQRRLRRPRLGRQVQPLGAALRLDDSPSDRGSRGTRISVLVARQSFPRVLRRRETQEDRRGRRTRSDCGGQRAVWKRRHVESRRHHCVCPGIRGASIPNLREGRLARTSHDAHDDFCGALASLSSLST